MPTRRLPLTFLPTTSRMIVKVSLAASLGGRAVSAMFVVFDTDDVNSENASFVGTERLIRGDHFHGQPCPTDPPSYQYSWLFPRFGWDYYICHTFDSPW